jgi:polyisoprenoid-binding protein YceI
MRALYALPLLALILPAPALASTWELTPEQSSLGFSGIVSGEAFEGHFQRFEARIVFDPDAPEAAQIDVSVDMRSADAGSAERTDSLPGADWFNAGIFPQAGFVSRSVRHESDNRYVADGVLSIKGVNRPTSLPFSLDIDGDTAHAVGRVTVNRSDWRIGEGDFEDPGLVGRDVVISFDITAWRAD